VRGKISNFYYEGLCLAGKRGSRCQMILCLRGDTAEQGMLNKQRDTDKCMFN
jgi:hypothetical protein